MLPTPFAPISRRLGLQRKARSRRSGAETHPLVAAEIAVNCVNYLTLRRRKIWEPISPSSTRRRGDAHHPEQTQARVLLRAHAMATGPRAFRRRHDAR